MMSKTTNLPGTTHYLFRPNAERPMRLLRSCPTYAPSPLCDMTGLAAETGVSRLWFKDESNRMGLGSFKALGGAFAVAQIIAEATATTDFSSTIAREAASNMTFITASAGNHGLSVAAGARIFGARAVIVLSAAVPEAFADRIRAKGADVLRIDGSYDESVEAARQEARKKGWILLADGSWEGYTKRPALVMEGYCVIAEECRAEFSRTGEWPTHILLQAGVGGLAAAMAAHVRQYWAEQPELIIVEPEAAPCLQRSVAAGRLTRVEGPQSNMGRLDCKDASLIAFETLRHDADAFVTVSDTAAEAATRRLAGQGVNTTPSGAATFAALTAAPPGPDARCLLIISEGPVGAA